MQGQGSHRLSTPGKSKDLRFHGGAPEQSNDKGTNLEFELYAREKELEEFDLAYTNLLGKIREIHKDFLKYGIEETAKFVKKAAIKFEGGDDAEKGKKNEAENMLRTIGFIASKIVEMKKNIDAEINKRHEINYTKSEEYEDLLHKLENEVEEKLKTIVDTAYLKIEDLEKKTKEKEIESQRVKEEAAIKAEKIKEVLKHQTAELKLLKEDHAARRKPNLNNQTDDYINAKNSVYISPTYHSSTQITQATQGKGDLTASRSMLSATVGPEKFNSFVKKLEKNKLESMASKQELKTLKRTNEKELSQEQATKHNELLISRLKIQVSERNREIERLKKDFEKVFAELKSMKEKELEMNKKIWAKEVLSDKNPNIAALIEKRERSNKEKLDELTGKLRRYATNEKRLFIKEKAFELERAEYHDRILYLSDRVTKLLKINEELGKESNMTILERTLKRNRENPGQEFEDLNLDPNRQGVYLATDPGSTAESFMRGLMGRNLQTPNHLARPETRATASKP